MVSLVNVPISVLCILHRIIVQLLNGRDGVSPVLRSAPHVTAFLSARDTLCSEVNRARLGFRALDPHWFVPGPIPAQEAGSKGVPDIASRVPFSQASIEEPRSCSSFDLQELGLWAFACRCSRYHQSSMET